MTHDRTCCGDPDDCVCDRDVPREKVCARCHISKPLSQFRPSRAKSGRQSNCKGCRVPRGPLPWQPDFPTRFWAKVDRSGECWEWLGFKDSDGYGKMWDGETQEMAHRSAVRLNGGVIPPDYTIDHLCRNRGCVNPAHLEPVTRGENTLRGEGLSARNARKTHCVHGHEFTPENTLPSTDGARRCRTCKDAWGARRSQRNKERRYAA